VSDTTGDEISNAAGDKNISSGIDRAQDYFVFIVMPQSLKDFLTLSFFQ